MTIRKDKTKLSLFTNMIALSLALLQKQMDWGQLVHVATTKYHRPVVSTTGVYFLTV